jgi:thiol-disulfide isomerase/thioredoxin
MIPLPVMIRSRGTTARRPARRLPAACAPVLAAACWVGCWMACVPGCGGQAPSHPAVGRTVGSLPLVSLADRSRTPPRFAGRVTLLNFFGTWCLPCRRELPGLARLAERLRAEPAFQLVAVSCGSGGYDDPDRLAALTGDFLAEQRLAIDAWADPDGRVRMIFQSAYAFNAYPTTYLIGPDGRIRAAWSGYRQRDEADMARAVVAALKDVVSLKDVGTVGAAAPLRDAAPPQETVPDGTPAVEPAAPAAR